MAQGQAQGRPPLQPRRLKGDGSGCESAGQAPDHVPPSPRRCPAPSSGDRWRGSRFLPGLGAGLHASEPLERMRVPAAAGAPVAPDRIPVAKGPVIFLRGLQAARGSSWACKAPGGVGGAFTGRGGARSSLLGGEGSPPPLQGPGGAGGEGGTQSPSWREGPGGRTLGVRTRSMLGERSGARGHGE